MYLQYQTVSDENGKLAQETSMLKYKIGNMQEELDQMQKQYTEECNERMKLGERYKKLRNSQEQLKLVGSVIAFVGEN